MCACDLDYTCTGCGRLEKWEPDDRELEEAARMGLEAAESAPNGPEPLGLRIRL